jgi:SET domain-containing protein
LLERFETADGRGAGVRAKEAIAKRTVLIEYRGVLLTKSEALEAEERYERGGEAHCYTFWFRGGQGEQLCLDGTRSGHMSRFINHSKKHPNVAPKLLRATGDERPRIVFKAIRNIAAGEEVLFDYNENRPHVLDANPWLRE